MTRRFISTDPATVERFGDPFRPLEDDCTVVQFSQALTEAQLARVGQLVARRPDIQLYLYGQACRTLDVLAHFCGLERLHVALFELEDISGLTHVSATLRSLTLGRTKRRFSASALAGLSRLDHLFLVGPVRDLDAISRMEGLRSLGLSGMTLPNLAIVALLKSLTGFSLFLGGTGDLGALRELPALENLFLMRVTKLDDLSVLSDLVALTTLRLDWMRNVTALPSFAPLTRLREVRLDTMKGLLDLAPVAAAPNLQRLTVQNMPQLAAEAFRPLLGHPTLRELSAYTGRKGVNDAVKQMFGSLAV
jgi:hypothetical protein